MNSTAFYIPNLRDELMPSPIPDLVDFGNTFLAPANPHTLTADEMNALYHDYPAEGSIHSRTSPYWTPGLTINDLEQLYIDTNRQASHYGHVYPDLVNFFRFAPAIRWTPSNDFNPYRLGDYFIHEAAAYPNRYLHPTKYFPPEQAALVWERGGIGRVFGDNVARSYEITGQQPPGIVNKDELENPMGRDDVKRTLNSFVGPLTPVQQAAREQWFNDIITEYYYDTHNKFARVFGGR